MEPTTNLERLPNIHPGEILRLDFLEPMGITPYRLAKAIGVPPIRVTQIVHGQRGITADTALRLSRYFRTTAQLWMNLQSRYELEEALTRREEVRESIEKIVPYELVA